MIFKKLIIFLVLLFSVTATIGQISVEELPPRRNFFEWPYSRMPEDMMRQVHHQSIQPFIQHSLPDSIEQLQDEAAQKRPIQIKPLAYIGGGYEFEPDSNFMAYGLAGLKIYKQFNRRWSVRGSYVFGLAKFPSYLNSYSDRRSVFPGLGYDRELNNASFAHNLLGNVTFTPTEHFSFQLGNGKNFWGNGHRSLILNDFASPYPYFKINTRVWKIQYTNLYTRMQNLTESRLFGDARTKYMASHALSINIGKKFNVTLFESVVWQGSDSLSDRGFEFNYVNPVIFYRPVEYYQGSADNVLMGLGFNLELSSDFDIYGQLVLDEFLLREVLARDGWWANKYAAQIGFKVRDIGISGLRFQSEFNFARPFTYTHGSPIQSYTHLGQSLAHPLGTNFYELVNILSYKKRSWKITEQFNFALYGRDTDGENYGGDILHSYADPHQDYGNEIGQGLENEQYFNKFTIEKLLSYKWGIKAFVTDIFRLQKNELQTQTDHIVMVGLRMNMSHPTMDF